MDIDLAAWSRTFLFLIFFCTLCAASILHYEEDDAAKIAIEEKNIHSHLKVFSPSLPYSYVMRLINGNLLRLNESKQGWEYSIAYKHEKIDELTYDFWIRDDVRFQDGTPLDAGLVVKNLNHFIKGAFTFTNAHNALKYAEEISPSHIRIHLNIPYGMLLNDIARIHLYTNQYLENYGWASSTFGENTKAAGAYGAGPYILVSGEASGLSQSDKIELVANPYYFEKGKPYVEKITIYTRLPIEDVIDKISNKEGELDIAIIPFDKKTEIVNSPYSKLVTRPSSNHITINMNLIKKNSPLQNKKVRQALNYALNHENLINFTYKHEGTPSPFPLSSNSYFSKDLSQEYVKNPRHKFSENELLEVLNGLKLKVVTQDRFYSLFRGIEYQLARYGVSLEYDITTDEKYVLKKLLTNRANAFDWDLLIWGNDDWYVHPWGMFFALYTKNQWSSIDKDDYLDGLLEKLFRLEISSDSFQSTTNEVLEHIYDEAYMLSVPSPNVVIALNKEVDFKPSSVAIMKLWDAKVTPYHWSIRGDKPLPKERLRYILPKRIENIE